MADQTGINIQTPVGFGASSASYLKSVPGWEITTAQLAGSLEKRLSTQAGLQYYDPDDTALREPLRRGMFLVKVLKWPAFFPQQVIEVGRWMMEEQNRGVGGLPDNNLGRIDTSNGIVKLKSSFPGFYEQSGNALTLKMPEYATSPLRKFLKYWVSGISDKKIGINHFYGQKLRGVQANKSATFIYILLGPTARPEDIEYACILHDCMPYTDKMAHLASDIGEVGNEEIWDIESAGTYDDDPEVEALAQIIVEGYALYGESFMNSALPAYIYQQIISNKDNASQMQDMFSIDSDFRMQQVAANSDAGSDYTKDVLTTRTNFRNQDSIANITPQNP